MIECIDLTKDFGGFLAVDRINLYIGAGEVMALLGPNGAGKTTSVRMMTSIIQPTSGTARLAGYDVTQYPEQVRASVGVLTEQHGLYERMKAIDYLDFFGRVYHLPAQVRRKHSLELMERFGLNFALDKRLGDYSKGMKQKLALVRAMLHNPPVLLLDEPTSAMDPLSAKQVRDAIIELQRDERTFLITTHNLSEAQTLADRIAIIRHGRIVANGTFDELARQFAGIPKMELRFSGELNGFVQELSDLVTVESFGEDWLQFRTDAPHTMNPQVLRKALGLGVDVVTLAPVTKTLEDIYLQVVQEDEQGEIINDDERQAVHAISS
ncbi:MAG: ABC-type multidrug transport system, ATPase component [Chloroflexi bacterium AL-W]|nr:ABC-type multidrug transport system, ATPase component [Chloroflexi bacterium AL-W]